MKVEDLASVVGTLGHADRILLFGWWLHAHNAKATFMPADIGKCYHDLHMAVPSGSLGPYFATLTKNGQLLKNTVGYRLEGRARAVMEEKHGQSPTTVAIAAMLVELPAKLPTLFERTYLDEALTCYRNGAVRAAIVMTWNLAYAHLCDHIVKNKLAEFNAQWLATHAGDHKKGARSIKSADDFASEELGESKVLKIALDCGAIVKNVYNVLEPALKRRNAAAHPNNVLLTPLQTEAYIEDLVNNAVLKIK